MFADELRSSYLNKVENALKLIGLTFSDWETYIRVEVLLVSVVTLLLRVISEMMPKYRGL